MAQDCLTTLATVAAGLDSDDTTNPLSLAALQRTSDKDGVRAADLVKRQFTAAAPNRLWVADVRVLDALKPAVDPDNIVLPGRFLTPRGERP